MASLLMAMPTLTRQRFAFLDRLLGRGLDFMVARYSDLSLALDLRTMCSVRIHGLDGISDFVKRNGLDSTHNGNWLWLTSRDRSQGRVRRTMLVIIGSMSANFCC